MIHVKGLHPWVQWGELTDVRKMSQWLSEFSPNSGGFIMSPHIDASWRGFLSVRFNHSTHRTSAGNDRSCRTWSSQTCASWTGVSCGWLCLDECLIWGAGRRKHKWVQWDSNEMTELCRSYSWQWSSIVSGFTNYNKWIFDLWKIPSAAHSPLSLYKWLSLLFCAFK